MEIQFIVRKKREKKNKEPKKRVERKRSGHCLSVDRVVINGPIQLKFQEQISDSEIYTSNSLDYIRCDPSFQFFVLFKIYLKDDICLAKNISLGVLVLQCYLERLKLYITLILYSRRKQVSQFFFYNGFPHKSSMFALSIDYYCILCLLLPINVIGILFRVIQFYHQLVLEPWLWSGQGYRLWSKRK